MGRFRPGAARLFRGSSAPVDRAAEGLRLGGMDRPPRQERIEGVPQVRRSDLRGDPAVIAELSLLVEDERFRRPPRVEKAGQLAQRISNHRKRVSVLLRVRPDLVGGLRTVAVDGDEKDPLRPVLPDQVAEGVVVVVRVRTERRPEDHHDRAMVALRVGRRKRLALNGRPGEGGNGVSDIESGRAGGKQDREEREEKELADRPYSAEATAVDDFRAKLRITRWGEKPQFNPTARPGWTA